MAKEVLTVTVERTLLDKIRLLSKVQQRSLSNMTEVLLTIGYEREKTKYDELEISNNRGGVSTKKSKAH